jgi:hypothetical protein
MGRLIVHIGTHKTATTSLQRHLAKNRAALAARGILYPDYDLIGRGGHYAHLGIVNALSGQHDKLGVADAQAFFAAVMARVPDHDATILSAEPFYRHVAYAEAGAVPPEPERYWPLRRAYVERVRELFAPHPVEVVVVFRRQADYAHSLYQEQIKSTRYREDFRGFRPQFWYHFDYLGQARAWAAAFALRPLRFEDLVAGGDPVAAFGAHLGLDLSGPERVSQQNLSLHPDAVVLKRILHATHADKDAIRADIEAVLKGPLARRIRKFKNRSLYADAADLAGFQAGFAADNETLRRDFFPALPAPLFAPDFPAALRFGDALHPHFLNMLVQALKPKSPPAEGRP